MKQHTLNWLSFSLFFFLIFSCKKKDDFLPLKIGKYNVDYFVIHADGTVDNHQYIAYGPKITGNNYSFTVKATDSTTFCGLTFSTAEEHLRSFSWINSAGFPGYSYKINSYDCSEENLRLDYSYFPYSDSISGVLNLKLLEE